MMWSLPLASTLQPCPKLFFRVRFGWKGDFIVKCWTSIKWEWKCFRSQNRILLVILTQKRVVMKRFIPLQCVTWQQVLQQFINSRLDMWLSHVELSTLTRTNEAVNKGDRGDTSCRAQIDSILVENWWYVWCNFDWGVLISQKTRAELKSLSYQPKMSEDWSDCKAVLGRGGALGLIWMSAR